VSCSFDVRELTSAKIVPYFMTLSTTLSVCASIIGEYWSNNPSSSLSDERRDSVYPSVVTELRWGGELQRDVQQHLQRIVVLECKYGSQ